MGQNHLICLPHRDLNLRPHCSPPTSLSTESHPMVLIFIYQCMHMFTFSKKHLHLKIIITNESYHFSVLHSSFASRDSRKQHSRQKFLLCQGKKRLEWSSDLREKNEAWAA